ncbi:alkyl hydroperoxide reductase [Actinorhabdospora filicis]|uniref:Alkyl hydroperoxide reductase n=1 Tax=Actinorhabdospora filicis TaxID=1785913 RepID=A0A9W6WCA4_9ACTN|nr:TlpA disulfide reductase family protein [Actinorhabdospora filicis]GLZ80391.1 alkyl hydroperoxide reductase [Actinorhabdospora filicis]
MRKTAVALVIALALTLTACGTGGDTPSSAPDDPQPTWAVPCVAPSGALPPGDDIGKLALPCLGGDQTATPLANGMPTVLNLWASWCQPCRTELPEVDAFYKAAQGEVAVLGVDTSDTASAARFAAEDFKITFPSRHDADGRLLALTGKRTLPVTVLLRADGTVAHVYNGTPLTRQGLADLVAEHLGVRVGV